METDEHDELDAEQAPEPERDPPERDTHEAPGVPTHERADEPRNIERR